MSSNYDKIRQTINDQLILGACCRIHIHRECCLALGLDTIPIINEKQKRVRICKDLPDQEFNDPFNDQVDKGVVEMINSEQYECT